MIDFPGIDCNLLDVRFCMTLYPRKSQATEAQSGIRKYRELASDWPTIRHLSALNLTNIQLSIPLF